LRSTASRAHTVRPIAHCEEVRLLLGRDGAPRGQARPLAPFDSDARPDVRAAPKQADGERGERPAVRGTIMACRSEPCNAARMTGTEVLLAKAGSVGARYGLKKLAGAIKSFTEKNDVRLREAWEHERRDHVVRKLYWLEQIVADLQSRIDSFAEQVEAQTDDPQLHRVWDNFVYEAIREATNDRREMLEAADAGTVDPRLSVHRKARVERTLRQLDPEDVRALYGIDRMVAPKRERYETWKRLPNGDILVAAGCLRMNPEALAGFGGTGTPVPEIAPLGSDVLKVMRLYLRKHGPSFEVPGHHPEPDAAVRERAWGHVDMIPGLRDFLDWSKRASGYRVYNNPNDEGPHELAFYDLKGADAGEARRLIERIGLMESDRFRLEVRETDDSLFVQLKGPHDVLRVVADDLDARWTSPAMWR
jgi:hypothetical protein